MTIQALPRNDDAFWTPNDLDHFFDTWKAQGLPEIDCYDANGAKLWIKMPSHVALNVCAERLELPVDDFGDARGVEFARGDYEVRIVAERKL